MDLAQIVLKLWRHRRGVAAAMVVALLVAVGATTVMGSAVYAAASTQMLIDAPRSSLGDAETDLTPYTARASVFARLMTAPQALDYIGQAAGIPGNLIAASGPEEIGAPQALHAPTSVQGGQIVSPSSQYSLRFDQNPLLPTVDVYAQAPTVKQAIALANGSVNGFGAYLDQIERQSNVPINARVQARELGTATGGMVNPGASKKIAALVFVGVFALLCWLVLFADRFRAQLKAARSAGRVETARHHGDAVFGSAGRATPNGIPAELGGNDAELAGRLAESRAVFGKRRIT